MQAKNILLTGGRGPAVLEMARQLARQGHTIYVAESTKIQYCLFSNAVKKNFLVPDPLKHEAAYIDKLTEILKSQKIDTLIPAYDETYFIAKHKAALSKHAEIFCDDLEKIKILNNKYSFAKLMESLNCRTPETLLIKDEAGWKSFQEKPALKKPYMVKSFYASGGSEVVTIRETGDLQKIRFKPPFIVQEFTPGKVWSTTGIAHNGNLTLNVVYEPVFVYRENGPAICLQGVQHPSVLALVKYIVQKQKYTGLIGFDVIEKDDGTLHVLECNPRVTSGVHLITQSDNIAACIFNPQAELREAESSKPVQISFAGMLKILFYLQKGQFSQWLHAVTHSRDAIFDTQDVMPALTVPIIAAFYLRQYIKYKKLPDDNIFYHLDW